MRILHIYKDYFPVLGGMENHIKLLAEAQAAQGHHVTVLVTSLDRTSHTETRNRVRVLYTSRLANVSSSAPVSLEMFRRVREIEPDITHLHSPYPPGEIANYLFGRARATVLTYQSDIVRQRITGALYTPFLHRVLARVCTIIATSPNYIESSPVLVRWREKCVVIPLASPIAVAPVTDTRSGTGWELLFVGRLRYYKGVNYLIEALASLPNARLTVVGIGPKEQEWKALAQSVGVASRVKWVGEVNDDELARHYAGCDIFVLPCSERSEAFGAVQLEAMAAGKPVVSCDVNTGVAWVNQNEVTGLVVPPKNPAALAEAIRRLMNDAELRQHMGQAGQQRVAAEFTVDKMVQRIFRVYENALHPIPRTAV